MKFSQLKNSMTQLIFMSFNDAESHCSCSLTVKMTIMDLKSNFFKGFEKMQKTYL